MKSKYFVLVVTLVALTAAVHAAAPTSPLVTKSAGEWLQVLQSNGSTRKDKADACRELAVIGDQKAVPVLVALLADPEMSHMARYALETIRGAEVDQALREQLPRLQGRLLVGVVGSLGVRKDAKAVTALAGFLSHNDPEVAKAAARALGSIGNAAAANALETAITQTTPANRIAFCEGLFRCAEAFGTAGKSKEAGALYDRLLKLAEAPNQVRLGALRGAILLRGKSDLGLLKESLESSDRTHFSAAVRAALELGGPEVVRILSGSLSQLQADNQIVVLQALGSLGDALAVPAIHGLAKSGEKRVRLQAIEALAAVGQAPAVPVLVALLSDSDREVSEAALNGLAGMSSDTAALALLKSAKAEERLAGINLIGRRRVVSAAPTLLNAAADADARVRTESLQRLAKLGTAAQVSGLLSLMSRTTTLSELRAQADTLGSICSLAGSPPGATEQVIAAFEKAPPLQRTALLLALGAIGGEKALNAVRAAAKDPQAEVRGEALSTLAQWTDAAALPDLLGLLQAGSNPAQRAQIYHGYVRLVRESGASPAEKLKQLSEVMNLATRPQEKMLVLAGLGEAPSVEALKFAVSHLADAAVAEEAGAVAVKISEKLDAKNGPEIGVALNQVLKVAKAAPVRSAARKRLTDLKLPID